MLSLANFLSKYLILPDKVPSSSYFWTDKFPPSSYFVTFKIRFPIISASKKRTFDFFDAEMIGNPIQFFVEFEQKTMIYQGFWIDTEKGQFCLFPVEIPMKKRFTNR